MMWTIQSQTGSWVRSVQATEGSVWGLHPWFGWISEPSLEERRDYRKRRGLSVAREPSFVCKVALKDSGIVPLQGAILKSTLATGARIATSVGEFEWTRADSTLALDSLRTQSIDSTQTTRKRLVIALGIFFALLTARVATWQAREVQVEALPEPVTVRIIEEKTVAVPKLQYAVDAPVAMPKTVEAQARRAIQQDLGFLGLLGKKNLTQALGGIPTDAAKVSPGAGAGGSEGSGGEVLQGLGQGVKRVTVGNSGVAGLGGVGTKGAGGGAGGYGNSLVGSGEGKGLTAMPVSQELVLEGGLDRSTIQATIAKYLSQVRACYEQGLARRPGIQGQVSMAFEINAGGRLNSARVARSTLGDAPVENCITERMMNWEFPKPVGGVNVKVNYPFLLRPVGGNG